MTNKEKLALLISLTGKCYKDQTSLPTCKQCPLYAGAVGRSSCIAINEISNKPISQKTLEVATRMLVGGWE